MAIEFEVVDVVLRDEPLSGGRFALANFGVAIKGGLTIRSCSLVVVSRQRVRIWSSTTPNKGERERYIRWQPQFAAAVSRRACMGYLAIGGANLPARAAKLAASETAVVE